MMGDKFSGLFDISSDALRQQNPKKQENNLLLTTQSNSTEVQMGLQPSFNMSGQQQQQASGGFQPGINPMF